jgi:hypothetical protein
MAVLSPHSVFPRKPEKVSASQLLIGALNVASRKPKTNVSDVALCEVGKPKTENR